MKFEKWEKREKVIESRMAENSNWLRQYNLGFCSTMQKAAKC